ERAPPRRPVVAAACGVKVDGIPLRRQRLREHGIVRVVLLVEAAGDRRRQRTRAVARVQHGADEPLDAREAKEARLLAVRAAPEEAARLEEEAGERARLEPVRVQEREPAQAHAEPDATSAPELVERPHERAAEMRRGG